MFNKYQSNTMNEKSQKVRYDLEERTYKLAINVRKFLKPLSRNSTNIEDGKQLIRSSASIAANYIEANEALSRKDFFYRIKICRKEAKESILFLRLLDTADNSDHQTEKIALIKETTELMKIFGAIITRKKSNN